MPFREREQLVLQLSGIPPHLSSCLICVYNSLPLGCIWVRYHFLKQRERMGGLVLTRIDFSVAPIPNFLLSLGISLFLIGVLFWFGKFLILYMCLFSVYSMVKGSSKGGNERRSKYHGGEENFKPCENMISVLEF